MSLAKQDNPKESKKEKIIIFMQKSGKTPIFRLEISRFMILLGIAIILLTIIILIFIKNSKIPEYFVYPMP